MPTNNRNCIRRPIALAVLSESRSDGRAVEIDAKSTDDRYVAITDENGASLTRKGPMHIVHPHPREKPI